jgi:XTP/dITP diphosphohydrolase
MRIVLASSNQHKLEELVSVLPISLDLVPQARLGIVAPEETGLTFVENAIIKARHASQLAGLPAIADDSGLEVDYLQGSPGIYSSRYAGSNATDQDNNSKLLDALLDVAPENRQAKFQCVIVFMRHALDPTPVIAMGTWAGSILNRAQGTSGFGYDPLFHLSSLNKTAAELSKDEKNSISHRGQALAQLQQLMLVQVLSTNG